MSSHRRTGSTAERAKGGRSWRTPAGSRWRRSRAPRCWPSRRLRRGPSRRSPPPGPASARRPSRRTRRGRPRCAGRACPHPEPPARRGGLRPMVVRLFPGRAGPGRPHRPSGRIPSDRPRLPLGRIPFGRPGFRPCHSTGFRAGRRPWFRPHLRPRRSTGFRVGRRPGRRLRGGTDVRARTRHRPGLTSRRTRYRPAPKPAPGPTTQSRTCIRPARPRRTGRRRGPELQDVRASRGLARPVERLGLRHRPRGPVIRRWSLAALTVRPRHGPPRVELPARRCPRRVRRCVPRRARRYLPVLRRSRQKRGAGARPVARGTRPSRR